MSVDSSAVFFLFSFGQNSASSARMCFVYSFSTSLRLRKYLKQRRCFILLDLRKSATSLRLRKYLKQRRCFILLDLRKSATSLRLRKYLKQRRCFILLDLRKSATSLRLRKYLKQRRRCLILLDLRNPPPRFAFESI
jgi:hypothetical protein